MPEQEYQRLTRTRSRSAFAVAFVSRTSLWLGKDHLLCVDSSGYTETYKRFYFRDIQVITLVTTKRRTVWNGVLVVPIVICLAGLANSLFSLPREAGAAIVTWAIFSAVFIAPLLLNNLMGPTCTGYLRTAVQIEELPSLNRLRRARKVLERIRPFITAVQGGLSPDEISARIRAAATSPDATALGSGVALSPPPAADTPAAPPVIS
ncbi:MAG: hypothetical protein ACLQAH_09550 [Limisphaerales bacterium]